MLHIRWSKGQADVEGTRSDLADLHRRLLAFAPTKEPRLLIEADATIDPAPYERTLKGLTVEKSQALVTAQVLADRLYISGKPNLLALLARTIPHSEEQSKTSGHYHAHFDQASNPTEVHERSAEMRFTIRT